MAPEDTLRDKEDVGRTIESETNPKTADATEEEPSKDSKQINGEANGKAEEQESKDDTTESTNKQEETEAKENGDFPKTDEPTTTSADVDADANAEESEKLNGATEKKEPELPKEDLETAESNGEDVTDAETTSDIPTALPKIVTNRENDLGRHSRAVSVVSNASVASKNSTHISFVKTAITSISEHKEAKKNTSLVSLCKKTLDKLNSGFDSALVFQALRLSIETKIVEIVVLALDCISKIFTFQLFEPIQVSPPKTITATTESDLPAGSGENIITPPPKINLIDAAIETIASSFDGEGTDERIEIQVTRALMAGVLNEQLPAHGSTLLRAIRQIYNIFILSLSPVNQGIAQASLTQIVNVVFDKVEKIPHSKPIPYKSNSSVNVNDSDSQQSPAPSTPGQQNSEQEPLTLKNLKDLNDEEERVVDQDIYSGDEHDLIIKDAFLLFRAMCKLSIKSLENESLDMRSHAVRSKLISLHIIHSIIKEHIDVFLSNDILISSPSTKEDTRLVDAVRQYLCLTISRNAASAIPPVFETTLEIFWLIVSNLRSEFKREIPVFLNEIYFPVAEMKTSTSHQKRYFLIIVQRLCNDPRALIEFYLNYDCDTTLPNICEKLTDYLTKLALTKVEVTANQKAQYKEHAAKPIATYNLSQLPLLSISKLSSQSAVPDTSLPYPVDYALKITSLNCVVGFLRSLNSWAQKGMTTESRVSSGFMNRKRSSTTGSAVPPSPSLSVDEFDDPQEFESLKQRKTALQDGIRQFNYKPKRGIDFLVKQGFIEDKQPRTIAKFLLEQPGLDKTVIGEYLGEGDEENIAIMHAFVDEMEFSNTSFVDAMRTFLQPFRLPGEAQKIDRFMLKFAERYLDGNPNVFANADTAYILAYSVVLLNTDQHSKNVKNRMTTEDFIKNNRGIDDGKSLPDEFLINIYNEIAKNEIKLQSEQQAALLSGDLLNSQQQGQTFTLFGNRDVNREAYIQASKEISNKTEKLFKTLGKTRGEKKNVFYSASHVEHVKSIFDTLWMSFLAALTAPFKDIDDDDTIKNCLEGLKLSINIAASFDLDYARTSFIGALIQFANLSNLREIKSKNVEAIILLLKIAENNGNNLKNSWRDILTTLSQVERLQLISKGIEADLLPDVTNARVHRNSLDSTRTTNSGSNFFFGLGRRATPAEQAQTNHQNQHLDPVIAERLTSTDIIVVMDKVYTQSAQLNGGAIIDFIKALTDVAYEEIESSLDSTTPRTFSLQKVIDVCYYNMGRIRLEWSPIWAVMGECFNKIGTKHNLSVVFFALDSLRQLAMRFMDIEELSGFKFQEDFLKPFDYILRNSRDVQVSEMCLNCLNNLIALKGDKIKSGWKTIFSALGFTASDINESIVWKTYELVNSIYKDHFEDIFAQDDSFASLVSTFRELAKNTKFQRISLHALQNIKSIVIKVAEVTLDPESAIVKSRKDIFKELWYPALFSFNDVIMTGDDLEVRSKALNLMFDILVQYGNRFDSQFWDQICVSLLFPIFGVLSKHWEINQFNSHDDLSVWLSTTLIQALRNMIALFTHYFDALSRMLDGYLGLLISCICQENDTIARIGRSCFQQLITQNMEKFEKEHWDKVTESFEKLFELTTAVELFEADPLKEEQSNGLPDSESTQHFNEANGVDFTTNGEPNNTPRNISRSKSAEDVRRKNKSKNAIVVKCILQLLMIETLSELFEDEQFYELVPYDSLVKLSGLLEKSFKFARTFNDDYNLRVRLWNSGVIDKLPNLLKQESSSSAVFINVTFKLYTDPQKITPKQKDAISSRLIPMCVSIVERYVSLDDNTQQRNISTWRPVVVEILQGYYELEEKDFDKHCPHIYDLVLNILDKSVPSELRTAIKAFFARVGDVYISEEKNQSD